MNIKKIEAFTVVGITVRTTNENWQSAQDIPALWHKFLTENITDRIPGKIDDTVYCIYTDYEKDYTRPYTTLLGCRVQNMDTIPEGLTGMSFAGGQYQQFTAKGKMMEGIVFEEWKKIWNSAISRIYTADFEIYGDKAKDPDNAEIDIFVAVA